MLVSLGLLLGFFTWQYVTKTSKNNPTLSLDLTLNLKIEKQHTIFEFTPRPNLATEIDYKIPIQLILSTPAGPLYQQLEISPNNTKFKLPYTRAGKTTYQVSRGETLLTGEFTRTPGEPLTPLKPVLAPRAIRITDTVQPAIVLHPLDEHLNVTELPVTVITTSPNDRIWRTELEQKHLLFWSYLPVPKQVGSLNVTSISARARAERGEIDLLPGYIAQARLDSLISKAPASGRDTWRLRFNEPLDSLGNYASDGSILNFFGGQDELNFFLARPLTQGEFSLILPSYPKVGSYLLQSQAGNFISRPVVLEATPLSSTQDLPFTWLSHAPPSLEIGPVIDTFGALPDDGSPALFSVYSETDKLILRLSDHLEDGKVTLTFPPLPSSAQYIDVHIAGQEKRIELP